MRFRNVAIFAGLCALMASAAVMVGSSMAAQKTSKGRALPSVSRETSKSSGEESEQPSKRLAAHAVTKKAKGSSPEGRSALSRTDRAIKAHKKVIPKAVVQPRTDLIHYGVLEDSQRYDPRPHAASTGVPSPQTPELTHDHFQELDRNQDGMIDPVERAFGRIDMDRDLHTRTLH